MENKLQCKDISNERFLVAVLHTASYGGDFDKEFGRSRWAVKETLDMLMGRPVPEKLVLAKARKLIRAGLLDGCDCGCRGDWAVLE